MKSMTELAEENFICCSDLTIKWLEEEIMLLLSKLTAAGKLESSRLRF